MSQNYLDGLKKSNPQVVSRSKEKKLPNFNDMRDERQNTLHLSVLLYGLNG